MACLFLFRIVRLICSYVFPSYVLLVFFCNPFLQFIEASIFVLNIMFSAFLPSLARFLALSLSSSSALFLHVSVLSNFIYCAFCSSLRRRLELYLNEICCPEVLLGIESTYFHRICTAKGFIPHVISSETLAQVLIEYFHNNFITKITTTLPHVSAEHRNEILAPAVCVHRRS